MKNLLIGLGVVLAVLIGIFLIVGAISPSDETVMLFTQSAGETHETTLWVVDEGDRQWLRAGNPDSAWATELRADPQIELSRGDTRKPYAAVIVETSEARDRINAAMAEKYGPSDSMVGLFAGDRDEILAIRLDPR